MFTIFTVCATVGLLKCHLEWHISNEKILETWQNEETGQNLGICHH